jgi:hypothetical protein
LHSCFRKAEVFDLDFPNQVLYCPISIGKLVRKNDGPEEVEKILATMIKYGEINDKKSDSTCGGSEN